MYISHAINFISESSKSFILDLMYFQAVLMLVFGDKFVSLRRSWEEVRRDEMKIVRWYIPHDLPLLGRLG
jgi:hypothetical protein